MPEAKEQVKPLLPHHLGSKIEFTSDEATKQPAVPFSEVVQLRNTLNELKNSEPQNTKGIHAAHAALDERISAHRETAGEIAKAQARERRMALNRAPDLEDILRERWKQEYQEKVDRGESVEDLEPEAPEGVSQALRLIDRFRESTRNAQALRKAITSAKSPELRSRLLDEYAKHKAQVHEYLEFGPSFEKAYREYLRERNDYASFSSCLREWYQIQSLLGDSALSELPDENPLSYENLTRVERILSTVQTQNIEDQSPDTEVLLEALQSIYPPDSKEFQDAKKDLVIERPSNLPLTKGDLIKRSNELYGKAEKLWSYGHVQRFYTEHQVEKLLADFTEGQDVLEMPSVIHTVNTIHEWETLHQNTTIGGVFVGPPGVGKTTLVRHYLESKHRGYAYIDLSEDVTRYLLYGSKDINFSKGSDEHKYLVDTLQNLDDEGFRLFIQENIDRVSKVFHVSNDEAAITTLHILEEQLSDNGTIPESDESNAQLVELKKRVVEFAQKEYYQQLGSDFAHLVKRNGWRDGVIVAALRRGDSVIFDEFNKNRNWSLIYSLMTAKPGADWYFADNDETIEIPKHWRMYFTANIGKQHGVFQIPEALASRAAGKIMEISNPKPIEFMRFALTSIANRQGSIVRSEEDISQLYTFIFNCVDNIQTFLEDHPQDSIALSYRTLRDLGEKLVQYRDSKTGMPLYRATNKTFDQALFEVLIDPYVMRESKTVPTTIINKLTEAGLLLDDSVKDRVVEFIGEGEYERLKEAHKETHKDFDKIRKSLQGLDTELFSAEFPLKQ